MKTRKKREKTGEKWARYDLKNVNTGSDRRDQLVAVADPLAWHLLAAVRGDSRASSEAQDESLTLTRPGEATQIFIRRYSAGGRRKLVTPSRFAALSVSLI